MSLTMSVEHLRKAYNGRDVVAGCSFAFDRPGVYVLTGPNGCGKSTFLRLCALVEPPDSGSVRFFSGGEPAPPDLCLKRRITLVLPKVGVFNTTVFRNVVYGLLLRHVPKEAAREKGAAALDFVGLGGKGGRNALTLSSGETQRLGIARALAIEPEMLFLDEPTASVDRHNTALIEDIVRHMKQRRKTIVVMTTHDLAQAGRLADRLLAMDDGILSPLS